MNQANPSEHFSTGNRNAQTLSKDSEKHYLEPKLHKLMDPEEGFIQDDTIIIEVSLKVYVKQSTSMLKYLPLTREYINLFVERK